MNTLLLWKRTSHNGLAENYDANLHQQLTVEKGFKSQLPV